MKLSTLNQTAYTPPNSYQKCNKLKNCYVKMKLINVLLLQYVMQTLHNKIVQTQVIKFQNNIFNTNKIECAICNDF